MQHSERMVSSKFVEAKPSGQKDIPYQELYARFLRMYATSADLCKKEAWQRWEESSEYSNVSVREEQRQISRGYFAEASKRWEEVGYPYKAFDIYFTRLVDMKDVNNAKRLAVNLAASIVKEFNEPYDYLHRFGPSVSADLMNFSLTLIAFSRSKEGSDNERQLIEKIYVKEEIYEELWRHRFTEIPKNADQLG